MNRGILLSFLLCLPSPLLRAQQSTPEDPGRDVTAFDNPGRVQQPVAPEPGSFPFKLFTEGLWSRYSSNVIPDTALAEALNVVIDEDVDGVVVTRRGRARCASSPISDAQSVRSQVQFNAPDGTKFHIAVSSESIFQHSGNCTWTEIPGFNGWDASLSVSLLSFLGRVWATDGAKLVSWNGTSTQPVSGAPAGTLLDGFRNRLLIANINGSQSQLHLSGELDGENWALSPQSVSTSPVILSIGGVNDGDRITCLLGAYGDVYFIGKRNALFGLYGFDTRDFRIREISREVGCLEPNSVREKNNRLYWLSKRGIERMTGPVIHRVSDQIRDLVDVIIQTAGTPRSHVDSSQADWEEGNLEAAGPGAPMSATIAPGVIQGSTASLVDISSTNFSLGSFDLTVLLGDTVVLSTGSGAPIGNGDFEEGDSSNWTTDSLDNMSCTETGFASASAQNTTSPLEGSFDGILKINRCVSIGEGCTIGTTPPLTFSLLDGDGTVILGPSNITVSPTNIDLSALTTNFIQIKIRVQAIDGSFAELIGDLFKSGPVGVGQITFIFQLDEEPGGCSGFVSIRTFQVDTFVSTGAFFSSGTFISTIYNSGLSTPTAGVLSSTFTIESETNVFFDVRTSTSPNDDLWTDWAASSDTLTTGTTQQYWQYRARLHTTDTSLTPVLDDISLSAGTTAQYIASCIATTNMSSFKTLGCNFTDFDGSWTVEVSTGNSCQSVQESTATWNSHTNNTTVAIGTAAFTGYRLTNSFSLFVATGNPFTRSCQLNWVAGAARPPVVAEVYKDRYHLSYTSSTESGAANDHQIILDRNDKWVLWDNIPCASLTIYERNLYCGDSGSTGLVFQQDIGTNDDGSGFTSRIKTKSFNLGMPARRKAYEDIFLDLEPEPDPADSITLTARYYVDRGTVPISLGTVDLGEDGKHLLTTEFNFPVADEMTASRYIQIELESSGVNQPWRLFGGRLYYKVLSKE